MNNRVPPNVTTVLLNLDTVLIGVAISFAVWNLVNNYYIVSLGASLAFFLAALNFYHGKVHLVLDNDYQEYCTNRDPRFGLVDFIFHIFTIGSFAFMPFFLDNVTGYLSCHAIMRVADACLDFTILKTVSEAGLSTEGANKLKSIHVYWLFISLAIALFAVVMIALLEYCGFSCELIAVWGLLVGGVLDVTLDYLFHSKYYFARTKQNCSEGTSHAPEE